MVPARLAGALRCPELADGRSEDGSRDRIVNGHQFGPVGKGGLHLHDIDHVRNPVHHFVTSNHMTPGFHQLGNAAPVTCSFHDESCDECHGFRMVKPDTTLAPITSHHGRDRHQQPFLLVGSQPHHGQLRAAAKVLATAIRRPLPSRPDCPSWPTQRTCAASQRNGIRTQSHGAPFTRRSPSRPRAEIFLRQDGTRLTDVRRT